MSGIFGGSKSKSKSTSSSRSTNVNRDTITSAYQPLLGQAVQANNKVNAFLDGDVSGFDKFRDAAGYDFERFRGEDALGSQFAGRNVFRSGARDKAMLEFNQNLSQRFAEQYIRALLGQSGQSLSAGQLVAGVGNESTSTGTSTSSSRTKPGMGNFIGQVAAGFAGGG